MCCDNTANPIPADTANRMASLLSITAEASTSSSSQRRVREGIRSENDSIVKVFDIYMMGSPKKKELCSTIGMPEMYSCTAYAVMASMARRPFFISHSSMSFLA